MLLENQRTPVGRTRMDICTATLPQKVNFANAGKSSGRMPRSRNRAGFASIEITPFRLACMSKLRSLKDADICSPIQYASRSNRLFMNVSCSERHNVKWMVVIQRNGNLRISLPRRRQVRLLVVGPRSSSWARVYCLLVSNCLSLR